MKDKQNKRKGETQILTALVHDDIYIIVDAQQAFSQKLKSERPENISCHKFLKD